MGRRTKPSALFRAANLAERENCGLEIRLAEKRESVSSLRLHSLEFTKAGITERAVVFANVERTVVHSQPIIADVRGNFPPIWLEGDEPEKHYGCECRYENHRLIMSMPTLDAPVHDPLAAWKQALLRMFKWFRKCVSSSGNEH